MPPAFIRAGADEDPREESKYLEIAKTHTLIVLNTLTKIVSSATALQYRGNHS